MDKRTLIVLVISLAIGMAWIFIGNRKAAKDGATSSPSAVTNTAAVKKQPPSPPVAAPQSPAPLRTVQASGLIRKETRLYKVDFSVFGGTIRNLYLKKYNDTSGSNLNLVELGSNAAFYPFTAYFTSDKELATRTFVLLQGADGNETVFQYVTRKEDGIPAGLLVEKRFIFETNSYIFKVDVTVRNTTGSVIDFEKTGLKHLCLNYCTEPRGLKKNDQYNQVVMSFAKSGDMKQVNKGASLSKKYWELDYSNAYEWAALSRRYFIFSMISDDRNNSKRPDFAVNGNRYGMTMQEALVSSLSPGGQAKYRFHVYAGPKDRDVFREYKRRYPSVYGLISFERAMGFQKILGPISNILLDALNLIFKWIPNYGVCIILLTFLIKLVFIPLTYKQYESMEKMKKVQPFLNALKEKYKDDQQKFNAETMAVYKKHKINPLSGCLPMIIQIPVFLAFYYLLISSIQMRDAHFLWIKDLARPDTVAWIAGLPLNIMPLLMALTQFVYQKMTATGDPKQQKILQFMPLIFLFIFWNLPSGLVLYWTAQNILSIFENRVIHALIVKKEKRLAEKTA